MGELPLRQRRSSGAGISELLRKGFGRCGDFGETGFEGESGFGFDAGMWRQDRVGERWILESADGKGKVHAGPGLFLK